MKRLGYLVTALLLFSAPILPQMVGETTYFTSFASNFLFQNNLHNVVPGKFYRSAQMSRSDLGETMREHKIKTVIDLRLKADAPDDTGLSEQTVVEKNGGTYVHIPFSSARADQKEKLEKLLEVYDQAETPVLVHCTSGTHRSGMAAALWLLEKENAPVEKAEEQISIRYGFIKAERALKAYFQGKPTLDLILRRYAAEHPAGEVPFRTWLEQQKEFDAVR